MTRNLTLPGQGTCRGYVGSIWAVVFIITYARFAEPTLPRCPFASSLNEKATANTEHFGCVSCSTRCKHAPYYPLSVFLSSLNGNVFVEGHRIQNILVKSPAAARAARTRCTPSARNCRVGYSILSSIFSTRCKVQVTPG